MDHSPALRRREPQAVPGCDVCEALLQERRRARREHDHSRVTDCNVELRNHDHGRRPSPQELLGDAFPAVRNTLLAAHPGMSLGRAEMITAEAVKFVVASAQNPGVPLAPSRAVDTGWHALLLHTAAYAELCGRYGTFVHHLPGCDPRPGDPDSLRRARRAVEGAGFEAVEGLWRA